MKVRDLLKKFGFRSLQVGEDERPVDQNVDALATMAGHGEAPTDWVPSQQDERPRH